MAEESDDARFAENMRLLREQRGWSQGEMARRMQAAGWTAFHQTTVSRIEKGERPVRIGEAIAIANLFGQSVRALTLGPDMLDYAIETRKRIAQVYDAIQGLEKSITDLQRQRVELAFWLTQEHKRIDRTDDSLLAEGHECLEAAPMEYAEFAYNNALRAELGELPGSEVNHEILELLGWSPPDASDT